jgi:hypothetical protein
MVTGRTALLGMGAGEFGQFAGRTGMAVAALAGQQIIHRHFKRGMGHGMTGHAVEEIGSMRLGVTLAAFGHDFIPVVFHRAVGMKLLMAVLAVDTMAAAVFLYFVENTGMALGALRNG